MKTLLLIALSLFAFNAPAFALQPIKIGVYDTSGADELSAALPALQEQLSRDFCPYYMKRCATLVPNLTPKPMYRVFIVGKPLVAEGIPANGYHWYDSKGPYALVTTINKCPLSICASHELMEMLSDPLGTGREICDNLKQGYPIDNEWVVDFWLPPKYHETFCQSMPGLCE